MSSSQVLRQYTHRKTKQTKHKQQQEKKKVWIELLCLTQSQFQEDSFPQQVYLETPVPK